MKKYFKDETLKPYEEMAVELQQSVKTVYANNRDALRKAKEKLTRMGFKKEDFFGEKDET